MQTSTMEATKQPWQTGTPVALAALSGVLFALALPPRNVEWVGWFAFVPLLVAIRVAPFCRERLLPRFLLGLLCGIVAGVVQIGWNASAGSALQFAYLPYVWIAMVIGLVVGLAGGADGRRCGLRGGDRAGVCGRRR